MTGNKPSPQDKTKQRLTKDKQALKALIKKAEKHLVEGHSPFIYDFVDYTLNHLEDPIRASTKLIDNSVEAEVAQTTGYISCAERDILGTTEIYAGNLLQILTDADLLARGYTFAESDKVEEYFQCAYSDASVGFDDLDDAAKEIVDRADDGLKVIVDDKAVDIKDYLDNAEENGAGFWSNSWDFLMELPATLLAMSKLIQGFVEVDPEKFVDDNIELMKAQKKLQERVEEEGI